VKEIFGKYPDELGLEKKTRKLGNLEDWIGYEWFEGNPKVRKFKSWVSQETHHILISDSKASLVNKDIPMNLFKRKLTESGEIVPIKAMKLPTTEALQEKVLALDTQAPAESATPLAQSARENIADELDLNFIGGPSKTNHPKPAPKSIEIAWHL